MSAPYVRNFIEKEITQINQVKLDIKNLKLIQVTHHESCRVFWFDFLRNLLLVSSVFLIFFARASPKPSTFANSAVVAPKTFRGVPNLVQAS